MDRSDPRRDRIHELLQELGPESVERDAVLVGWAVVTDWIDDEGTRYISRGHSASIPSWVAEGLYHHALHGDWPAPDSADDPE